MIDESFSKMDEARCKAVLDYLSGTLGLQVICVVPTKSAGALHDHVDQVLQVTKFLQERPRGELNTGVMVTSTEIVSRLAAIPALVAKHPLSTYQVSARLFWGNSKVLKGQEQWLRELLGLPDGALVERMLLVEIAFPSCPPTGILMLENLDSYFSACNGNWPHCHDFI
jgi:hypothetical protein